MPIKLENVGIAVRDLEATIAFFTDLGLTVLGRDTVSGEWTDTAVGLDGNHANIAMLQTPDGNGRLELFEYIHPDAIETEPTRPNEIGMHRVAFSVDDIDEALEIAARARLPPTARRGDLWGRVQAHLRPRPQRHHRHACRGAEEELTPGRSSSWRPAGHGGHLDGVAEGASLRHLRARSSTPPIGRAQSGVWLRVRRDACSSTVKPPTPRVPHGGAPPRPFRCVWTRLRRPNSERFVCQSRWR